MTQPQATAEVFWTAYQAMKPKGREAVLGKLMKDKNRAEDLRYGAIIQEAQKGIRRFARRLSLKACEEEINGLPDRTYEVGR